MSVDHRRIALLTDGHSTPFLAKTAISLLRYRGQDIVAVIDRENAGRTSQEVFGVGGATPVIDSIDALPPDKLSMPDAVYIGIAPPGGQCPTAWRPILMDAIGRGIDIVSGLHDFLADDPAYVSAAKQSGSRLIDVRLSRWKETASCHCFRSGCIRIHSVGADCSIGKMVTTLEIQRGLASAGHDAKFLATGQTGIMISGEGVPIDAIVADFCNGAAESLVRENEDHDYLLIEGQGSISHPAFSAVTLGLLHGTAPDGLVFCYQAGRTQVKGFDGINIPPMADQMKAILAVANLRHPCQIIGIAINTRDLSDDEAQLEIQRAEEEFNLPTCDVYRTGADKLVEACVKLRSELISS